MVTSGAGMALGRSSVRTGSIQQIVTPAPQSRVAEGLYKRPDRKMLKRTIDAMITASVNPTKLTTGTPT